MKPRNCLYLMNPRNSGPKLCSYRMQIKKAVWTLLAVMAVSYTHLDVYKRQGQDIMLETVLAPYRGERIVQQIPVKIPTSASKGTLRILVSDGDTLDRIGRGNPAFGRKLDLASTIALLNKEHSLSLIHIWRIGDSNTPAKNTPTGP